ncbi:MAG TPA: hypothetical protein VFG69_03850 [Nannocystaceae bacterium]|nr:hypothetical protein [Nannocystaceae bacterium]
MDEANAGVLQLRFRGHEVACAPPEVAAFCRPPPTSAAEVHARPHEVAVLGGREPLAPRTPLVIFFQHADFGIPPIGSDARDEPPDVSSWTVSATVFGWLASVPYERRTLGRSRATWVIAACLPLALVSEAVAAPVEKGAIQRPKKSQVVTPAPVDETPPTEPSSDVADPFTSPVPPDDTSEVPAPGDDEAVAPAEPPVPPKPVPADSDVAILDAAWEGVDGFDVELKLKGGRRLRGRVGAVQQETFTLIESGSGAVLVLPKSGVVSLRARMPPKLPTKTGGGLLAGGIVLTSIAGPVFISGIAFVAICPSCTYIHLPLLIIGAGLLAGGIPMTVLGARRRMAYRKILDQHALSPVVSRTPHGWTGGLRLRF